MFEFTSLWSTLTVAVSRLAGIADAGLPAEVVELFRDVFAGGRLTAAKYKQACPSIIDITRMPWFSEDLPAEAKDMTRIYCDKTAQRKKSEALRKLEKLVNQIGMPKGSKPRKGGVAADARDMDIDAPEEKKLDGVGCPGETPQVRQV